MQAPAAFAQVRDNLVVTLLGELESSEWRSLQQAVLRRVSEQRVRGVVLDASAVTVLDAEDAQSLQRTMAMCRLLGAPGIVVGLSVPLVAALVQLGSALDGLEAEASVEAALDRLMVQRRAG